jgi:hypothetical protein
MSDPKKNFVCKENNHIINDMYRIYGKDTKCIKRMLKNKLEEPTVLKEK